MVPKRFPFNLSQVLKTDLESLEQLFKLQSDPLLLQLMDIDDDAAQDTFIIC